ncbi:MAG: hypothetical protein ACRDG4_02590 [Chloroflexota bacterium]
MRINLDRAASLTAGTIGVFLAIAGVLYLTGVIAWGAQDKRAPEVAISCFALAMVFAIVAYVGRPPGQRLSR